MKKIDLVVPEARMKCLQSDSSFCCKNLTDGYINSLAGVSDTMFACIGHHIHLFCLFHAIIAHDHISMKVLHSHPKE